MRIRPVDRFDQLPRSFLRNTEQKTALIFPDQAPSDRNAAAQRVIDRFAQDRVEQPALALIIDDPAIRADHFEEPSLLVQPVCVDDLPGHGIGLQRRSVLAVKYKHRIVAKDHDPVLPDHHLAAIDVRKILILLVNAARRRKVMSNRFVGDLIHRDKRHGTTEHPQKPAVTEVGEQ